MAGPAGLKSRPPADGTGSFSPKRARSALPPDAYGLSVARELERPAGRRLSRGALYMSLDRLETKGLLRWKLEPGGPERHTMPKRVYSVLPRGVSALRTSQRELRRMWRGLDHILRDPS